MTTPVTVTCESEPNHVAQHHASRVEVRRAVPDDRQALYDFVRAAYPDRWQFKIPHRWEWQFENNPFRDPDRLPVWIALDGKTVIGQTCAMIEPVANGPHTGRVGWSVDTFVVPEYRGQGIGYRLQQAGQADHQLFMSMSMSPANRGIKQQLGGRMLPAVVRFTLSLDGRSERISQRLARCSPLLAGTLARTGISRLAGLADRTTAAVRGRMASRTARRELAGLEVKELNEFDTGISQLTERLAPQLGFHVQRTPEYLNWKFRSQPHMEHQRFVVNRNGSPEGYIVVRRCRPPEPEQGIIVDLLASPDRPETAAGLVALAVGQLTADGARSVRAASSLTTYQQVYRRLGFRETGRWQPMCHTTAAAADLAPGDTVFLGCGDHDVDQYPLAKL